MIKVSIIVPVYRIVIQYLEECINSLLLQTLKEIEVILIDDGSLDECSEICDKYARQDPRIQVIHQDNQGVSVARNVGIHLAKGKWITFVDADDIAAPDLCKRIFEFAESFGADIAMFSNYIVKENGIFEHPFFKENIYEFSESLREEFQLRTMILLFPGISYRPENMLIGHTFGKLIRREYLLNSNILFDPVLKLQQDGIFYLQLTECGGKITYLNEPLYYYRIYETSNCRKIRSEVELIYGNVRRAYIEFIKEHHKPQIYYDAFNAKCIADISQSIKNDFFNPYIKEDLMSRLKRLRVFLRQEPFKSAIINADKNFLTKLKRRNLFYFRRNLLWLLWIDWKLYEKIN